MNIKTDKYWVNHFNFLDEVKAMVDIPDRVEIYDVSLREGNQTPAASSSATRCTTWLWVWMPWA